jgi:hypothetical protein
MTRLMTRLTNTLTAAAVAAATLAAPAPVLAGDKDVLKGLAAIAAIALVAGALQQRQGGGAAVTRNQPLALLNGFQGLQGGNGNGLGVGNGWQNGNPPISTPGRQIGWQDRAQPRLPAVCAIDIDGRYPTTIYADACLRREGFAQSLPQDCAQQIRSRDWAGRVYDGACLRDAGFRAEGRY